MFHVNSWKKSNTNISYNFAQSLPITLPLEVILQISWAEGGLCFNKVKAPLFYNKTVPTLLMTI